MKISNLLSGVYADFTLEDYRSTDFRIGSYTGSSTWIRANDYWWTVPVKTPREIAELLLDGQEVRACRYDPPHTRKIILA